MASIVHLCPACDGYPGIPPSMKGARLQCEQCLTWLLWDHLKKCLMEAPSTEIIRVEGARLTRRDVDHLPPLVMTAGGRLVQRCIGCWDEVEFLTSTTIAIGRLTFIPVKPPTDPPPEGWERKWIPVIRMQKGPGCQHCLRDYTAYCGKRGMKETSSREGERKRHPQPYIPVGREHFEEVQQWLAKGSAYAEPLGWRLLIGVKDHVPSSLALRLMRSCEKRFTTAQRVQVVEGFGTVLLWDGPFPLHKIVPLKIMLDRLLPPSQKEGMLIVVEKEDHKMRQHIEDLKAGKTLMNIWGREKDPAVVFEEV